MQIFTAMQFSLSYSQVHYRDKDIEMEWWSDWDNVKQSSTYQTRSDYSKGLFRLRHCIINHLPKYLQIFVVQ